ncbi:hypothetical protein [Tepidiforma sp.]|uniref:hypothetical protein n=1 Tax=Tepidiforma sp. TaxID=2682230 RepID=UPI002ADE8665|nr:hypothetical protein [Tepidiforma sp.]
MTGLSTTRGGVSGLRAVVAAGAAVAAAAVLLLAVVVGARVSGGSEAPPEPGPFVRPAGEAYAAFDVERVDGNVLRLSGSGGTLELEVPDRAPAWLLVEAESTRVAPGMAIAVLAVPNEVRNFAIRAIVAGEGRESERPAGQFWGHEVAREAGVLPVITGTVERVEADRIEVRTGAGSATVWLTPDAPLYLAVRTGPGDVGAGDRVAFVTDTEGKPLPGQGLLILRGE